MTTTASVAARTTIERRTLFDGPWLEVGYIAVRPASSDCGEIEVSPRNVLALPLAGVFAKHDGPQRQSLATPNHALLINAGQPYRLSFPGGIGDRCLALRFTAHGLATAVPHAMAGDGFDTTAFAPHALLPPELMLARSRLWRCLAAGDADPLEAEERSIVLLAATLRAARRPDAMRRNPGHANGGAARRRRRVQATLEAIWTRPEHKWTLGQLAARVHVSPGHLAHLFRAEMGVSVYDYVVRSRLAGALDALLDTNKSMSEIALDAGFASHSHFTARFHALFSRTPLAVRRRIDGAQLRQMRTIVTARETLAS